MRHARRGFTLIELLLSGLVLAVVMGCVISFLTLSGQERRVSDQRQIAAIEVANVMQRITATPWTEVTEESLAELQLSPEAAKSLSDGRISAKLVAGPDDPAAKRITLLVEWPGPAAAPPRAVRLTSWIYRRGAPGASP